jgi:hypothetical protein
VRHIGDMPYSDASPRSLPNTRVTGREPPILTDAYSGGRPSRDHSGTGHAHLVPTITSMAVHGTTPAGSALADLGDPRTWPSGVRTVVDELYERASHHPDFDGPGTYAADLTHLVGPDLSVRAQGELRAALSAHHVLAYHATRLLPHETTWIKLEGMQLLSHDLRRRKLTGAMAQYPDLINECEVELLTDRGPCSENRALAGVRLGQLHVVAPFEILRHNAGLGNLLSCWGGESIAWAGHRGAADWEWCAAVVDRLSRASIPTVVEVAVRAQHLCEWQPIWPVMVGGLHELRQPWNEWVVAAAIPPEGVIDVVQPDHPRWPIELTQLISSQTPTSL